MVPVGFEPGEHMGASNDALSFAHKAQIANRRRAIILFEGPDGAGKKTALKRLAGSFDPCCMQVTKIDRDRREAGEGHWLARYWRQLPSAGQTQVFYRSWYRKVLDERIAGRISGKQLERAYDEINEFEAQQHDYGTLIVKLYFDVSAEKQAERLLVRSQAPWPGDSLDEALRVDQPGYAEALADLRANTDTRWAPWTMIRSDDLDHSSDLAMLAILEAFRGAIPMEMPVLTNAAPSPVR